MLACTRLLASPSMVNHAYDQEDVGVATAIRDGD